MNGAGMCDARNTITHTGAGQRSTPMTKPLVPANLLKSVQAADRPAPSASAAKPKA